MSNFDHYKWRNNFLAENQEYEVEYWRYTDDGYDNRYVTVNAKNEEEAIEKAIDKVGHRLNKKFKIYRGPSNS